MNAAILIATEKRNAVTVLGQESRGGDGGKACLPCCAAACGWGESGADRFLSLSPVGVSGALLEREGGGREEVRDVQEKVPASVACSVRGGIVHRTFVSRLPHHPSAFPSLT